MRVGVVGCGNVGLSTLLASAKLGYLVKGFDVDIFARSRVRASFGPAAVAQSMSDMMDCNIIFICVPTDPDGCSGRCDISIFETVVRSLAPLNDSRSVGPLVVQRSTCPPGTARAMRLLLGEGFDYAVNPSFMTKSTMLEDAVQPPRIAYAGGDMALSVLDLYYKPFGGPTPFRSFEFATVELLKYAENATDAVLISLWNELFVYGLRVGVSCDEFEALLDHIGDRNRFASAWRVPGGAFGKWCLPKDLRAFVAEAGDAGAPFAVLAAALITNDTMYRLVGENPNAYHDLLSENGGRLRATDKARSWMRQAANMLNEILSADSTAADAAIRSHDEL